MEVRLLGPVAVVDDDRVIDIPQRRQRSLLALLAVRGGETVAIDRLVEELWGADVPKTAVASLQNAVSQLRKLLGAETLVTREPGYALDVDRATVDAARFEHLLAEARAARAMQDEQTAATVLREALALWRGPALAELAYEPFAQAEIRRLEELRQNALEERVDADLALGRHDELVPELEAVVREEPLRERPRGQLMLALYRAGRQADALEAYRAARATLVEELQPAAHQDVVIRNVAGGEAQFLDAGLFGHGDPDFRRQHAFHVEGHDRLLHRPMLPSFAAGVEPGGAGRPLDVAALEP